VELFGYILDNWDTIGLIISNVVAFFLKSPLKRFQ